MKQGEIHNHMVSNLKSVILALFLLLLTAAHGRIETSIPSHDVDGIDIASSLLDSGKTDPNDAMALQTLIYTYPQLTGVYFPRLTNDPCAYPKLSWITCSNDYISRVTALDLAGQSLFLTLPDFSSMNALVKIDLQRNSLFGPIPEFLGTFPKLQYLNLANNFFTGPIPVSLSRNKNINLIVSGNPGLCSSTGCSPPTPAFRYPVTPPSFNSPDTPNSNSHLPTILGVTIPPSLIIAIFVAVCAERRRKRNAVAAVAAAALGGGVV